MSKSCCTNGGEEECRKNFGGKARKRKNTLGRPRRRYVNNIKMDFREIAWVSMDWIDLPQVRDQSRVLVNTVINIRVPKNAGKFLSNCTTGVFLRRAQLHEVN
jgi:hypothetical protein